MPDSLGLPQFPAIAAPAATPSPLSDAQPLSASPAVVNPNMLGQIHSGASIRVVPCDPFLQDRGKLLRLLLRIGWPVLRVHVWHHMLEHPDLVPRSLRPASLRRDRESSDWFVPGLAALPDYGWMLRCLPYVLRHCDGL